MKKVIVTVGTSIFTNFRKGKGKEDDSTWGDIEKIETWDPDKWDKNHQRGKRIYNIEKAIEDSFEDDHKTCAEIESLLTFEPDLSQIELYLIATDTLLSRLAAKLIVKWLAKFRQKKDTVFFEEVHGKGLIKGLQIKEKESFEREGFPNLIKRIEEIYEPPHLSEDSKKFKREGKKEVFLNISGGYKALIPGLSILGQLFQIPLIYKYEDSPEIILQNSLPIEFAEEAIDRMYPRFITREKINKSELADWEASELTFFSKMYGFFGEDSEYFFRTAIGDLFNRFIEKREPESVRVMGFAVELLFYKYLIENGKEGFQTLAHSHYAKEDKKGPEFDFWFSNNASEFAIGEVKSAIQVVNAFEEYGTNHKSLSEQIRNQIAYLISQGLIPTEYHLYFYFNGERFVGPDTLKEICLKLKSLIEEALGKKIKFMAKYFEVGVHISGPIRQNPLTGFMQKGIKPEMLHSIL